MNTEDFNQEIVWQSRHNEFDMPEQNCEVLVNLKTPTGVRTHCFHFVAPEYSEDGFLLSHHKFYRTRNPQIWDQDFTHYAVLPELDESKIKR